jgi:hypothetical protein
MSLASSAGQGKRLAPAAKREILIHALRTAVSRTKLINTTLETISVQLRHRQVVTVEQTMQWLRDENLTQYVQIGPKGGAS